MSKVTPVTSSAHFRTITSSAAFTVVDFYADWCGPCKVISPIFEQLATAESKPGKIVFCKVDVDAQREIAGNYGVSAMPTFLILKGTHVKETIRGANPTALRTAVLAAAADAAKSSGGAASSGAFFSGKGQTLGSGSGGSAGASRSTGPSLPNLGAAVSSPAAFAQGSGLPQTIVRFLGLYFTTLFSTEPAAAAEASPFRVQKSGGGGARVGGLR